MAALPKKGLAAIFSAAHDGRGSGILTGRANESFRPGADFLGSFSGDPKVIQHNLSLSGNESVIATNAVGETARASDSEAREEKEKNDRRFSELLVTVQEQMDDAEQRMAELQAQAKALAKVLEQMERGETVVGADGRLINPDAEEAVQRIEQEHGVKIDRNDSAELKKIFNTNSKDLKNFTVEYDKLAGKGGVDFKKDAWRPEDSKKMNEDFKAAQKSSDDLGSSAKNLSLDKLNSYTFDS